MEDRPPGTSAEPVRARGAVDGLADWALLRVAALPGDMLDAEFEGRDVSLDGLIFILAGHLP